MEEFTHISGISSRATRSAEIRTLSDAETRVYEYFMEVLGNSRVPRSVVLSQIAGKLGLSYWEARKSKDSLVKKGFLEQWTTTHRDPEGSGGFRRTTYYRMRF
ncbi:MAG: hypothetical protein KGI73_04805 [Patescibacteria group bacterium]|nr:hypothetical protein [Patescibacteria group bacterium]